MNHLFFFSQKTPLFYKCYVRTKALVSHCSHNTLNTKTLLNTYSDEISNIKENKEIKMNSEKFTKKSKKTMRKILNFFAEILEN